MACPTLPVNFGRRDPKSIGTPAPSSGKKSSCNIELTRRSIGFDPQWLIDSNAADDPEPARNGFGLDEGKADYSLRPADAPGTATVVASVFQSKSIEEPLR
jgi:hypothetical protein